MAAGERRTGPTGSRNRPAGPGYACRLPTEARPHPVADCYVVAPASAKYVAKLATGIAKNQALTQVSEALGTIDVPVVVFPRVNAAHVRRPA
ncbi:flavoprotein [Streptomyces sp. NBC_01727]|uniref:flavoprotein n=1 Tax=Streptomyces sp. NBC_01727 TaxID=2975924 RepID=UPI002E0EF5DC|nr:flavoprotein [Streptomyces sp. NBC_01727]